MFHSSSRFAAAAVVLALALATPTRAGQVRINVGGAMNQFSPATASVNAGDHVVWIWTGGSHTVTSGNPTTEVYDGKFRNSTSPTGNTGKQFFWKSSGSGAVTYFCSPHAPTMAGTITVLPSGVSVANFRITELEFSPATGDRVQISNLGGATGSLHLYRVSSSNGVATSVGSLDPLTIASNARVTLHLTASGTNTATDIFIAGAAALGTAGSFALYVPNNTTAGEGGSAPASLTDANQMVDYVEWGTVGQGAQANQSTAVTAGLWSNGDVVETTTTLPAGGAGYSISFCGSPTDHGASFWQISTPNFGTGAVCSTPTRNATWGRIKALYR